MNLAPLRYRNILAADGGPIQRLDIGPGTLLDRTHCFHSNAFLQPHLRSSFQPSSVLYGDIDGGGTSESKIVACHIAVSEALERWAYYATRNSDRRSRYAFDIADNTSGMAAFPGLSSRPARRAAWLEAVERWSLCQWWSGRLAARSKAATSWSPGCLEILVPFTGCSVVILWAPVGESDRRTYGFAAGPTVKAAIKRATIELSRNSVAIQKLLDRGSKHGTPIEPEDVTSPAEQSLVYFSEPHGGGLFDRRVFDSLRLSAAEQHPPALIVDSEIDGPWSRYTTVWRILFYLDPEIRAQTQSRDFFIF